MIVNFAVAITITITTSVLPLLLRSFLSLLLLLFLSFARKPTPEQLQAVLVLLAIRGLGNWAEEGASEKKGPRV